MLLNSNLSANSNHFYFDYKNGKYGFNTDPNRGADTFNPFKSDASLTVKGSTYPKNQIVIIDVSGIKTITINLTHTVVGSLSSQWTDIVADGNVIKSIKTTSYSETLDVSNYSTLIIQGSANGNTSTSNNVVTCEIII